jgi:hypothetical protein
VACRAAPERTEGEEVVGRLSETLPFRGAEYLADQSFASIRMDNEELVKLLVAIVKTSREGTHVS